MSVQARMRKRTPFQAALQEADLPRAELARALGVNTSTLWRWLNGRSAPSSAAMRDRAAEVLGRSRDELFPAVREAA